MQLNMSFMNGIGPAVYLRTLKACGLVPLPAYGSVYTHFRNIYINYLVSMATTFKTLMLGYLFTGYNSSRKT